MRKCRAFSRGDDGFKGHALGADEARLVFEFRGDFNLADAGADEVENVLEELAADQSRLRSSASVRLRP